jgi:hypothetical protein
MNTEQEELVLKSIIPSNTIFFMKGETHDEILRLCVNGDIFVKGKLIENDKEVVDALREFLESHNFIPQTNEQ